jgi:hypothetical protein
MLKFEAIDLIPKASADLMASMNTDFKFPIALLIAVLFFWLNPSPVRADSGNSDFGIERITFDLGASFGSYNNHNYTEAELGLNLYFSPHLDWRSAVFARFPDGQQNIFGIDESLRAIASLGTNALGFTAFAGPGYRFATVGDSAPFFEGGAVVKISGFAIGVGAKSILDSWVRTSAANDTQIFLILAGGASL